MTFTTGGLITEGFLNERGRCRITKASLTKIMFSSIIVILRSTKEITLIYNVSRMSKEEDKNGAAAACNYISDA